MVTLRYKTRNSSTPQGKPRVYFCCHPDDFSKYFEVISDEVLSKQNCAIWYVDQEIIRDEDFFENLKQMQLFIMPVSTSLLCTENEALNTEFKFAIENHIPVLPLMQENGLEGLFNKKCGDLQFLDKHNIDVTAISYDEKLRKYLESVLIGDELAEKIRAAFDAYIFLSYRKKDRAYAQELMRLIHKNEFCRDVAIWYDEFLTPGENFNDSIKAALEKSGLFVLTVTPNLINEENYIITTEYPLARQAGKLILPVELVPTDRAQLSAKYEDIPTPTDAHNDAELSEQLLVSLKKIAIKESDASPEHNFFVGLAYLSGIDVEVDHERARELIVGAAENGLKIAHDTLVTMYRTGNGVNRDYTEALEWQLKMAKLCQELYNSNPTTETLTDVYIAYMNLGDLYKEFNLIDEAEEAYETMLSASRTLDYEEDSGVTKEQLANSLNRIALLKKDRGKFREFYELTNEVIKIDNIIYETDNWLVAAHTSNLGLSCYFLQDYQNARMHFENALAIMEENNLEDNLLPEKARIYNNLGLALEALSLHEEAVGRYKSACEIIEEVNSHTDCLYVEDYGLFVSNLASVYIYLKQHSEAKAVLNASYKTLKTIFKERKQARLIGIIASLQNLIARLYSEQEKHDKAEIYYKKALEYYLCWDNEFEEIYRPDIALVRYNLGSLYISRCEYDKAAENLDKAYKTFTELTFAEKTYRRMQAMSGYNFAISLCRQGKLREALKYLEVCFEVFKELVAEGLIQNIDMYKLTAEQIYNVNIKIGHPIKAIKFLYKALKDVK